MDKEILLKPKFIVDEKGKRVEVVLTIKEFVSLIEELEDLYDAVEADKIVSSGGERYSLEEVKKSLASKK